MSPNVIGFIGLAVLIIAIFARMPIAFALALVGFLGYAAIGGFNTAFSQLGLIPYSKMADYNIIAIPLFLLMSMIAVEAGISSNIYKTGYSWIGHVKGGLAMATVAGCGGFAAICGGGLSTSAAIGKAAYPEMHKYNYDDKLATGCIAAGGTVGSLIPPSGPFIIYGILTEQSVGRLFIAGILPGVLEVVVYMILIYILCLYNPKLGPAGPKTTFKQKVVSFKGAGPVLALFLLVMGGIYMGFFTPTEAGAIGSFGAFIIGFAMRGLSLRGTVSAFMETGRLTAMIGMLIVGGMIFAHFMAITKIPFTLADLAVGLPVNRYIILVGILIFYIIAGCFLDMGSTIILTVPILFPVIMALGFDPIWYGVLMIRVGEVGTITPPVGLICYVLSGATKVPVGTIFRGIVPFVAADMVIIAILVALPQISLWLPTMMKG